MGNQLSNMCNCNKNMANQEFEHATDYKKKEFAKSLKIDTNSNLNEKTIKTKAAIILDGITENSNEKNNDYVSQFDSNNYDDWPQSKTQKTNNTDNTVTHSNIIYENGAVYSGEVLKGNKHGKGKITYSNGSIYEGYFENDLFEGKGKFVNENGITFEGTFLKGKKIGIGIQYDKSGTYRYEGGWNENQKSGIGKENYFDGSFYEGNFSEGKKNGNGKITLCNGSTYEGQFKDDKIEGKGFFKWSEDQTYDGYWKENCLNGFGSFKKGEKLYKGYFLNDKKHGYGINYYLKTNTFIIGCWTDNNLNDLAIYSSPDKGEQLWIMKRNKIQKIIEDDTEIDKIKQLEEYVQLENFYSMITNSQKD